jgi:hypothetical protein
MCDRSRLPGFYTTKAQEILAERRPVSGFMHVRLFDNNAPSNTELCEEISSPDIQIKHHATFLSFFFFKSFFF